MAGGDELRTVRLRHRRAGGRDRRENESCPKNGTTSSTPTQPTLIVKNGNTQRKYRRLDKDVLVLGRAAGCDVGLDAPDVAPVHCVIVRTADGWRVRDCTGRGGTRLNGQSIQDAALTDDDVLQVGSFSFALHLPPERDKSRLRRPADRRGHPSSASGRARTSPDWPCAARPTSQLGRGGRRAGGGTTGRASGRIGPSGGGVGRAATRPGRAARRTATDAAGDRRRNRGPAATQ